MAKHDTKDNKRQTWFCDCCDVDHLIGNICSAKAVRDCRDGK